jgi:hypothetical protein
MRIVTASKPWEPAPARLDAVAAAWQAFHGALEFASDLGLPWALVRSAAPVAEVMNRLLQSPGVSDSMLAALPSRITPFVARRTSAACGPRAETKFFDGPQCPRGHTKRYMSTGACAECLRRQMKESRERRLRARLGAAA